MVEYEPMAGFELLRVTLYIQDNVIDRYGQRLIQLYRLQKNIWPTI